jgi:hypothetical protein
MAFSDEIQRAQERARAKQAEKEQKLRAAESAQREGRVICPKCNSDQIAAQKRGYKLGRSLAASMTVLPVVGLGLGLIGRNKIEVTCLACGHRWVAGKPK